MDRSADPEAELEAKVWIEGVIGHGLTGDNLHEGLKSGIALGELINVFSPGSVKSSTRTISIVQRENISKFLGALRKFGVAEYELFGTNDLYDGKDMRAVVTTIHALGRLVQDKCPDYDGPTLGRKVVKKTKIVFTKEQLAQAASQPSLFNAGPKAMAGVIPGTIAAVTLDQTAPSTGGRSAAAAGATSAPAAAAASAASGAGDDGDEADAKDDSSAKADATIAAAAASTAAAAPAATGDDVDGPKALPAGWEAMETDDGRTYYYHADNEVTQWDFPGAEGAEDGDAAGAADKPLPAGWEAMETDDGRTYYYHADNEVTQWDFPGAE